MENRRGRKIAVDLLACLGAGFILLLVAILIVPRFIDRGSMGDNLRSEVSKLVKGEFDYSKSPNLRLIVRRKKDDRHKHGQLSQRNRNSNHVKAVFRP
jgi:hypothetical protein